jgi:hypothetical protein
MLSLERPRREGLIAAAVVVGCSIGVGGLVTRFDAISLSFLFSDPSKARLWAGVAGILLLYRMLRCFWRPPQHLFVVKVGCYLYGALLFLGLAAYEQIVLFKRAQWPITATARLPLDADVQRAFWIGLLSLLILSIGAIVASGRRRADSDKAVVGDWDDLLSVASLLFTIGMSGVAIITMKTHTIPLLAGNIDQLRFGQASGLGYASLLEVCLTGAACVSGAALIRGVRARRYAILLLLGSLAMLVTFRVERTPLFVTAAALLFAAVYLGRPPSRRRVMTTVPLLLILVFAIGVYRLSSSGSPVDTRMKIVRVAFDVSPEFREQAWVYRIYPAETRHLGLAAIIADLSSVVPSRALNVIGVDKSAVYGDISHQYVAAMQTLAHYPSGVKPLRVGFAGEMWADFGWVGTIFGFLILGVLLGLVGRTHPASPLGLVRKSAASALIPLAFVTPLGSLLPLAFMLLVPLFLVQPLALGSRRLTASVNDAIGVGYQQR